MAEQNSNHIITALQKKWKLSNLLYCLLLALSVTILVEVILHTCWQVSWWYAVLIFVVLSVLFLLLFPPNKITAKEVARYLDRKIPSLEESTGLLLQPASSLSALQQLQVQKLNDQLQQARLPHPFRKKIQRAALLLLAVCMISSTMLLFIHVADQQEALGNIVPKVEEKILPGVKSVTIQITPPAYTGRPSRKQEQFNLQVEDGAILQWQIKTNTAVNNVALVMNDTNVVQLQPADEGHTTWNTGKITAHSGFYQLRLQDTLSELYKMEIIRDEIPVIVIRSPQPYTVVDFGQPGKIPLKLSVKDDYGIINAEITATIASGSGEGVQFKEKKLSFDNHFTGASAYDLQKIIDLPALGLHPGDELYFYVKATDNHNQSVSSDMYIITLPDTAQLMSFDGMVMGTDVQPEYFRSQRQIIIETEQLLRGKDTMTQQAFNRRSNDLGIDQKLLRLRYGKFLGEESETNIGESRVEQGEHDEHGHAEEKTEFGDAKAMLDAVTHKHDQAEDATFFEPAIKNQLKATLNEMWNSELRLRTFKPEEALPYEYKALRLLKELQQKSRTYVAKTGVKTTPLKPEKRLTGDLAKITQPVRQQDVKLPDGTADFNRIALSILEQLKEGPVFTDAAVRVLEKASQQLGREATAKPATYLQAYQSSRRVVQALQEHTVINTTDLEIVERGLYSLVTIPATVPQPVKTTAGNELPKQYFKKLNGSK
ncbi:MAG: DUF4175 family protein [Chitinophagaceae bacterium]